jgi:hypothetical protein
VGDGSNRDAKTVAEECLARGLAVGHPQSICWAITFNLCPVAIWSGDLDTARRLTSLAVAYSEKTFDHWNEWVQMYRVLLDQPADVYAANESVRRMIPAQRDLFTTLSPAFAGDDIRQRALRPPCWCSPELMRVAVAVAPAQKAEENRQHSLAQSGPPCDTARCSVVALTNCNNPSSSPPRTGRRIESASGADLRGLQAGIPDNGLAARCGAFG